MSARMAGGQAGRVAPLVILVALLIVPRLSFGVPVLFNGPLNSPGNLQLLAVGFAFGIAALSYNLLVGYTGVLSFGHALFFGAGVYLPAIALRHWEWPLERSNWPIRSIRGPTQMAAIWTLVTLVP